MWVRNPTSLFPWSPFLGSAHRSDWRVRLLSQDFGEMPRANLGSQVIEDCFYIPRVDSLFNRSPQEIKPFVLLGQCRSSFLHNSFPLLWLKSKELLDHIMICKEQLVHCWEWEDLRLYPVANTKTLLGLRKKCPRGFLPLDESYLTPFFRLHCERTGPPTT